MSKHSAPRSPDASAAHAAPAAPPAGPERTVSAACERGLLERGEAAARLHDVGRGQTGRARAAGERREVGAEQRREGGVDLGRRGALELAERADDLVRERDVGVREALAQRFAERLLVLRMAVECSRQTATDSGSSSAIRGRQRRRVLSARSTPPGPIRSGAPTRRSGGTSGAGCAAQSR